MLGYHGAGDLEAAARSDLEAVAWQGAGSLHGTLSSCYKTSPLRVEIRQSYSFM